MLRLGHFFPVERSPKQLRQPPPRLRTTLGRFLAIAALLNGASGCGGDSDDSASFDYTGVWNARFNLPVDDCQIVLPSVPGFVDVVTISQVENSITASSQSGFFDLNEGSVSSAGNMAVSSAFEGDFFGTGAVCVQETSLSFSPTSDDSPSNGEAGALFEMNISCTDGYACVSRGVGTAQRQPSL